VQIRLDQTAHVAADTDEQYQRARHSPPIGQSYSERQTSGAAKRSAIVELHGVRGVSGRAAWDLRSRIDSAANGGSRRSASIVRQPSKDRQPEPNLREQREQAILQAAQRPRHHAWTESTNHPSRVWTFRCSFSACLRLSQSSFLMPIPRFFIYPILPLAAITITLRHFAVGTWVSPEWQVKKRERMVDSYEERQLRAMAGLPPVPVAHGEPSHPFRYNFDDGKANDSHGAAH
jgi:hypothetical protein